MRGVFVGKLDRTDEFLLLTPAGAVKTRCVRRLEGDSAWDLQFLNLCVGSPWSATAKSVPQGPTIQPKDEVASDGRVKRLYLRQNILDKYGRTTGCPGFIGIGPHTEDCRARIEREMLASSKKRKTGESDVNPGGASSQTADTPKREGSEHASKCGKQKTVLTGCIAVVKKMV